MNHFTGRCAFCHQDHTWSSASWDHGQTMTGPCPACGTLMTMNRIPACMDHPDRPAMLTFHEAAGDGTGGAQPVCGECADASLRCLACDAPMLPSWGTCGACGGVQVDVGFRAAHPQERRAGLRVVRDEPCPSTEDGR